MRRIVLLLIAVLIIGLVPAVASAQTDEEKAAAAALKDAGDGLDGPETVEDWAAAAETFKAEVAAFKEVYPDLDYADLDAAIVDLDAAIAGGDLDEIAAAGAVAKAAAEAAQAEVPAPTAVNTGSEVDGGPSMALLALAAVLGIVAVGTLGTRVRLNRR